MLSTIPAIKTSNAIKHVLQPIGQPIRHVILQPIFPFLRQRVFRLPDRLPIQAAESANLASFEGYIYEGGDHNPFFLPSSLDRAQEYMEAMLER